MVKTKKPRKERSSVVFKEKAILESPPETYPKEPESHRGQCLHSNKDYLKKNVGYNCNDCGYFIPLVSFRYQKTEEPVHVAVEYVPETLKTPKIDDVQVIELPRAVFDKSTVALFSENLGEKDKEKLIAFKKLLGTHKLHSFQIYGNQYVFLLVK